MTKLRNQTWHQRPKISRLANILYPAHADNETREEMAKLAANERKKPPQPQKLLSDAERGCVSPLGNVAVGWPEKRRK
jgi:hypothetical protein